MTPQLGVEPSRLSPVPAAASRRALLIVWVLAGVFLVAHLAWLPPALEDVDSVNFALGVRDFDASRHQPHPPGYPVFIALSKLSTALFQLAGSSAPEAHGLAVWSAIGGAMLIVATFLFLRALVADDWTALSTVVLLSSAPLFWFTALRPLSDVLGLAAAFASLAALAVSMKGEAANRASRWMLILGAGAAALAMGIRLQTAALTLPLLAIAMLHPKSGPLRLRLAALLGFAVVAVAWAIPLVVESGGLTNYLRTLGGQAGEDFAGVVMLSTHPTPRVAALALMNTFALPWDSAFVAGVVLALAVAGSPVLLVENRRGLWLLVLVFGPYAVFHLLFHETVTTRYALPLIPVIALLTAVTLGRARPAAAALTTAALSASMLAFAVPAGARYSRTPSPFVAALSEMQLLGARGAEPLIAMHRRVRSESRRARQWAPSMPGTLLESPRDYEWLEAVRALQQHGNSELWFLADPARTDLELIDSEYRRTREYRWPFNPTAYVGGVRPGPVDWHIYQRPGWLLGRGWAITPEIGGITDRDGWGPHRQPSLGWVRRRPGDALMLIGGRNLGSPDAPAARLSIALDARQLAAFDVTPGFFMRFVDVPASLLSGDEGFARLTVRADPIAGNEIPPVALEQFNVQEPDVVQFGLGDGWFEPEFNPRTARSWRWMSNSAVLDVRPVTQDVVVRILGESPLRYFDAPPVLRVSAGGQVVSESRPDTDFSLEVAVPGPVLAAANGRVVLESSEVFVPGERDGSPDRRQLALRIYSVRVRGSAGAKPVVH